MVIILDINLNYAVIKSRDSYIQVVIDGVSRGQRRGSFATTLAGPTQQNTKYYNFQFGLVKYYGSDMLNFSDVTNDVVFIKYLQRTYFIK